MANWIKGAIKRPGAFTAKAKAAKMSVREYARAVLSGRVKASALTKRQASLALTLRKLAKRPKRPRKGYDTAQVIRSMAK